MREDDLERALGGEHDIVPGSGFVHAVMAAVREEADAPAPIPFPWGRALAGATLATITAIVMPLILYRRTGPLPSAAPDDLQSALHLAFRLGQNREAWTIAAALLFTALIVEIPRRFFIRTH
jgi:hypothetical protein